MKVMPVSAIEEALRPVAEQVGVELYEVTFKQGKSPVLTVVLDTEREGGIDLDTCERFHNAADPVLDALDPTYGQAYTFTVSSPGIDRPFKKPSDFLRNLGKKVEVRLYAPLRGEKFFEAVLAEYSEEGKNVTLEKDGERIRLNLSQIVKISQAIEFD